MSQTGLDDEVTYILSATIPSLHFASATSAAPAGVVPLPQRFHDLIGADAARLRAGSMARAAAMARELLKASDTEGQVVIHGDVHHGNVLDFDGRWLAIDPKGLSGHRAFDYANIFCNPTADLALCRFHRRLAIVSEHSGLDVDVVRSWVIAWCALSVTWTHDSSGQPRTEHAILSEFG
ncbi:MAG: hypothetical protein H7201_07690 [Candidatus Saccharibacteria bacterium]|nr:hypothetical protein [Microbacteriaceae bacterium]